MSLRHFIITWLLRIAMNLAPVEEVLVRRGNREALIGNAASEPTPTERTGE